jgi:hypothetical protein
VENQEASKGRAMPVQGDFHFLKASSLPMPHQVGTAYAWSLAAFIQFQHNKALSISLARNKNDREREEDLRALAILSSKEQKFNLQNRDYKLTKKKSVGYKNQWLSRNKNKFLKNKKISFSNQLLNLWNHFQMSKWNDQN